MCIKCAPSVRFFLYYKMFCDENLWEIGKSDKEKGKIREKTDVFCELFNIDFPLTVDCIVEARSEQVVSLSKDVDSNRKGGK